MASHAEGVSQDKRLGLGPCLGVLDDELLVDTLLPCLCPEELLVLGTTASALFILCNEENLWHRLFLQRREGLQTHETWKASFLRRRTIYTLPAKTIESSFLLSRWIRAHSDLTQFLPDEELVPRVSMHQLIPEEFSLKYTGPGYPVIITEGMMDWKCMSRECPWSLECLVNRVDSSKSWEASGLVPAVRTCKANLESYLEYLKHQNDESPHYIFDSDFGEKAPFMLNEFNTDKLDRLIQGDFLAALGRKRPPYRWFVAGPARTGAPWHIDPNNTSAWNALVSGRKRWALYPPGCPPPGTQVTADPDGDIENIETPTSLRWYLDVYPALTYEQRPFEFVQKAGEIVFIPAGWYHMVLNLEETVSVTQNFVNRWNAKEAVIDLVNNHMGPQAIYELERRLGKHNTELREFLRVQFYTLFEYGPISDAGVVAAFKDPEQWINKVERVLKHHEFLHKEEEMDTDDMSTFTSRANPIFLAHGWVVKFFSPFCNWDAWLGGFKLKSNPMFTNEKFAAFRVEVAILKRLRSAWAPRLVAHGYFYDPEKSSERWTWPYVILESRTGVSLASLRKRKQSVRCKLNFAKSMVACARWLGDVVAELHATVNIQQLQGLLPSSDRECFSGGNWYSRFLENQRGVAISTHWRRLLLPKRLLKELDTFLDSHGGIEELKTRDPVVLHGDLQEENVLVETIPSKVGLEEWLRTFPFVTEEFIQSCVHHEITWESFTEMSGAEFRCLGLSKIGHQIRLRKAAREVLEKGGGYASFHPTTLLDFADAKIGCPLYDLVALHISVFRCNKLLLEQFLDSYANRTGIHLSRIEGFTRKAMKLTLLHPCDTIRAIFHFLPDAKDAETFEQLEQLLWGLPCLHEQE